MPGEHKDVRIGDVQEARMLPTVIPGRRVAEPGIHQPG